mmetsp:Transcript_51905/g.97317  ORF Transcript_51905/g.97317 Transcript_51905/m.97317 type:complete len:137 (-) Transcript_51905:175-585(-)
MSSLRLPLRQFYDALFKEERLPGRDGVIAFKELQLLQLGSEGRPGAPPRTTTAIMRLWQRLMLQNMTMALGQQLRQSRMLVPCRLSGATCGDSGSALQAMVAAEAVHAHTHMAASRVASLELLLHRHLVVPRGATL